MIQFPKFPICLKSNDIKGIAKECTALLNLDTNYSFGWLTDDDRKALSSGSTLRRRNVLYKHYVCKLESARQEALATGFAEPDILPGVVLEALKLSPFDRLDGRKSRELRDAIGAVKRLDDEAERAEKERETRRKSNGRSAGKVAKSLRDKEIRAAMKQPKGQKPQAGRKAA